MKKPEDFTVLVVDDEPDIRTFLQTLLEDEGFKVVVAEDGEEALEKVKEKKPDLISLDLVMPRKSGIRFFYELRHNKEWAKIPVVIVTGHARDEKVRKEMDDVFAGKTISAPQTYLEKPVKPADYLRIIRRELGLEEQLTGGARPSSRKDELKEELNKLAESADPETLEAALNLLREKTRGSK